MPTGPTNTLFWNRFQYIFTIWNLSHKSKGNFSRSQNIDAPKKTSNCRGDRLLLPRGVSLWNASMYTLWVEGNWVLLPAVRTYGGLCFRAIFTPRFIPLCVNKELQPQKTQKAPSPPGENNQIEDTYARYKNCKITFLASLKQLWH